MYNPHPEPTLAIDTHVTEIGQAMVEMQRFMQARFTRLEALLMKQRPFCSQQSGGARDHDDGDREIGVRGDGPFTPKPRLEPPRCDGTEPLRWIYQVREYFDYYETPLDDRLRCVTMMLEGPAADWFRWRMNNGLIDSWNDFLTKFKIRFDPLHDVDYFGQLARTRQMSTVMEYQIEFEKILIPITDANECHLQSLFHSGPKNHLQQEVSLLKPTTLSESFALARELEATHQALVQSVSQRQSSWSSNQNRNLTQVLQAAPEIPLLPKSTCCFGKEMLIDDDEDVASDPDEIENVKVARDIFSLNSFMGGTITRSLLLLGNISNSPTEVLIDGGSIHPKVIEKLQWPVDIGDVRLLRSTLRTRWFSKGVRMLWIREDRVRRNTVVKRKYHRHKQKSKNRFVKVVESR
ncbi:hypothetical protein CASFOL_014289 [Castilleja foliolosa]|uniref:Ty3 transposon capsid-like protein domain-containing protein n=1 Tax=Castilleja foliolosa TaxID=1961234 RepID=A0ABD3DR47_9LAMI